MNINIKYFGMLSEITQRNEELVEISGGAISDLLGQLYLKYPGLKNKSFQVAQNQKMVSEKIKISEGEIALLPPFSGG